MVERTILKELGFSFYVIEHAHRFILFYVKLLDGDAELAQEAWAYCNDSLRTDLQLRSKAEVIACAAVKLAAAKLRRTLPSLQEDGVDWWAAFGVDGGELDRAAAEITSLSVWKSTSASGALTKSFLGDDAAVLAPSSGEEPASPRHRAGVASMAWRTTR